MPNNPDKKNTQDKQFNNPGSQQGKQGQSGQQGQQGKQGSGMGDKGGMKSGQPSHQGGQSGSKQGSSPGQFSEGTDDETMDRGRRADSASRDPNKKWSPSGGSEF